MDDLSNEELSTQSSKPLLVSITRVLEADAEEKTTGLMKSDHELLLANLQHHLNEDQIPVKKIGLGVFYYFHLLDNVKLQKLVTKEMIQSLMAFMFKNMREVPMNDVAICLQFLDFLDN